MKQALAIARKEWASYVGSPNALVVLTTFLAVTLFAFFWVAGFFARGMADVRPLFAAMPLLLIFLVAPLTMRQWSEEQRMGTVETLFTLPVARWQLLLGKFLAIMGLVTLALLLTLPIPAVVAWLGPLDWGPVLGGYLASLLLAAAYTAIGLCMSSLTDNEIVALLLTIVAGGLLYLAGAPVSTAWAGAPLSEWLRGVGSGSRFESIERGVLDLRDLVYYLSVTLFFCCLTLFALERRRWSDGALSTGCRRNARLALTTAALALVLLNFWLAPFHNLRIDLTAQRTHTLAATTVAMLDDLQEPLLIRAYVSARRHPLLDPLRLQLQDLLREVAIAGAGKVMVEVLDPLQDPDAEAEANQGYGIQPTAFKVAEGVRASSFEAYFKVYFDLLIRYRDRDVVFNFRDLVQVQPQADGTVEVGLRNLEYELTRGIKQAVDGVPRIDAFLAGQAEPVTVTLYVTPDRLPSDVAAAPATIARVAAEIGARSGGKVVFAAVDPDDPASGVTRQELLQRYGLQPIAAAPFAPDSYYLHVVVANGDATPIVYPAAAADEATVRTRLENAVLRTAPAWRKVVGLWTPPPTPVANAFGHVQVPLPSYELLRAHLGRAYTVHDVDLSSGTLPAGIDVLLLVAPQNLGEVELFAIDQYLMRGGAVVALAGEFALAVGPSGTQVALRPLEGTAGELLAHYGVNVGNELVMDLQNLPFPAQIVRDAGGFQVQGFQAIDYPFFVDVRAGGMAPAQDVAGEVTGVMLSWASPVTVDLARSGSYTVTTLLRSSPDGWLSSDSDIQPDFDRFPGLGFAADGDPASHPLAVAVQGAFSSYFRGKPRPPATVAPFDAGTGTTVTRPDVAQLDRAPGHARLLVVGSTEFVNDFVLQLAVGPGGTRALGNLHYLQNAVDWAMQDAALLELRGRGSPARLLAPLDVAGQLRWVWITCTLVLAGLALVVVAAYRWRRSERPMELQPRAEFKQMPPIG